jgi:pyrroline-5-carboxylate reductase
VDGGKDLRIGVIGAAGWLGGALVGAALDAGIVHPQNLALSFRSRKPERFRKAFWTDDNQTLADRSDVILVCVRPGDWRALKVNAKGKLLISVMAGIPLGVLRDHHQTDRVVRSLPNAAAEVGRSYTPWVPTATVSEADRTIVRTLFGACGLQDELTCESDIDYFTGLSGAGPAFPALLADAMMQDAVSHGIPAEIARRCVNAVIVGAGRLLEKRDACPSETLKTFLAYQGTTAAAIEAMRAAGFEASIARGLTAAFDASAKLGDAG